MSEHEYELKDTSATMAQFVKLIFFREKNHIVWKFLKNLSSSTPKKEKKHSLYHFFETFTTTFRVLIIWEQLRVLATRPWDFIVQFCELHLLTLRVTTLAKLQKVSYVLVFFKLMMSMNNK